MPVMDRACDSKRSTWAQFAKQDRKLAVVLNKFCINDKRIVISRGDLFKLARQGVSQEFVYATYIWGYPNGNRGRYRKVFNQVDKIHDVLQKLPTQITTDDDWLREYKNLKAIDEMGMSTWTKLLYFLRIRIGGVQALILDRKVVGVMQRRVFRDFTMLAKIKPNSPEPYPSYLRVMHDTAEELKVDEDKLEMFLFTFGNSLK